MATNYVQNSAAAKGLRALSSQFQKNAEPTYSEGKRTAATAQGQNENSLAPYRNQKLNDLYTQSVRRLAKTEGVPSYEGLDPVKDARQAVDTFWNTLNASIQLNWNTPQGKNPLEAAQAEYERAMERLTAQYQTNGLTTADADALKSLLEKDQFRSAAQVDADNQSAARRYLDAKGISWRDRDAEAEKELRNAGYDPAWVMGRESVDEDINFYRNLLDMAETVQNRGAGALSERDRELWERWEAENGSMPLYDPDYDAPAAIRERGEERASELENAWDLYQRTLEAGSENANAEAENWMRKNGYDVDWAKAHPGDTGAWQDFYNNLDTISRTVAEKGTGALTADQRAKWEEYYPQHVWDPADESSYENLRAYGQERAAEIAGLEGLYEAYAPTERQRVIYGQYLNTPEGAAAYYNESRGTEREQQARDNLWIVERREKYAQVPQDAEFEKNKDFDPNLTTGDENEDLIYKWINVDQYGGNIYNAYEEKDWEDAGFSQYDFLEGAFQQYQYMKPEEKAIYNALIREGRTEDAKDYRQYLEYDLYARMNENWDTWARGLGAAGLGGGIAASALSVPYSLIRGTGYLNALSQNLRNAVSPQSYRPVNYEEAAQSGKLSDSLRQGVMDNVNWAVNVLGQDVDLFDFLYSTAMSGADSAAAAVTGGAAGSTWLGAALLGAGAAQSAMDDIYQRGGTDRQIVLGGTVAGIFETLFEEISIGKFYDEATALSKGGFKNTLKNIGAQMGINFSEEFNTELADIVFDNGLMGENSKAARQVAEYVRLGMPEAEAKEKVAGELAAQCLEAGLGGALMGAAFGAASSAMSASNTAQYNKSMGAKFSDETKATLWEIAKSLPNTQAKKLTEKTAAEKASNQQVGQVYRSLLETLPKDMQEILSDTVRRDAANQAFFDVETGREAATAALMNLLAGKELTQEQAEALAGDEKALSRVQELLGMNEQEEAEKKEERKQEKEKRLLEEQEEAWPTLPEGARLQSEAPGKAPLIREAVNEKTGETESILGARLNEDGGVVVETDNGERPLKEMRLSQKEEILLNGAADMTPDAGRLLMDYAEAYGNVAEYVRGMKQAYSAGAGGTTLEKLNSPQVKALEEKHARAAWEAGRRSQRQAKEERLQEEQENRDERLQREAPGKTPILQTRTATGEEQTVSQVRQTEEGVIEAELTDGEKQNIEDLNVTPEERALLREAAQMEDQDAAADMIRAWNENQAEKARKKETANRQREAEREAARRAQEEAWAEEDARRNEEETTRAAEEARQKEEAVQRREAEREAARRAQEEAWAAEDFRRDEEEAAREAEEARQKEEAVQRREAEREAARRAQEEAWEAEDARRAEEKASRTADQAEKARQKEAANSQREAEQEAARRAQEEAWAAEDFRRAEEETIRTAEEARQKEEAIQQREAEREAARRAQEEAWAEEDARRAEEEAAWEAEQAEKARQKEEANRQREAEREAARQAQEEAWAAEDARRAEEEAAWEADQAEKARKRQEAEEKEERAEKARELAESMPRDRNAARDFAWGFRRVYEATRAGKDIKTLYGEMLTESQRQTAIRAGERARERMEQKKAALNEQAAKKAGFESMSVKPGNQSGLYFAQVSDAPKNQGTMVQLRLIDAFARQTGMQVRVYDTLGDHNGSYETGTNIVNLALDAEGGALTRVVSHEGYHYLQQWSPGSAARVRDFVLETLQKDEGYDLDARKKELRERYERKGQTLNDAQIEEEIVADALLDVIGTEENVKKLVKTDRTLSEAIQDWAGKTYQRLQGLIQRFARNSREAAAILRNSERVKQAQEMFVKALQNARENAQTAMLGRSEAIRTDADVQAFEADMRQATDQSDAQAAVNGLISQMYLRAEMGWIQRNQDRYEEGLQHFESALRAYQDAENPVALSVALEREGLDAQPNSMNQALTYAARQLKENDRRVEQLPEERFDLKNGRDAEYMQAVEAGDMETAERMVDDAAREAGYTDVAYHGTPSFGFTRFNQESPDIRYDLKDERENALEDIRDDADLYAQAMTDEEIEDAAKSFFRVFDAVQGINGQAAVKGAWEERLTEIAQKLLTATSSKYSLGTLKNEIRQVFEALDQGGYNRGEILMRAREIGKMVLEAAPGTLVEMDETTRAVREAIQTNAFYLTEDQKEAAKERYGTLGAYMRRMFGKAKIRKKAEGTQAGAWNSLADFWRETLTPLLPGTFAEDTIEADMPEILDRYLEQGGEKKYSGTFGANIEQYATSLGLEMLGDYLDAPWVNIRAENLKEYFLNSTQKLRETYQQRVNKANERLLKYKDTQDKRAMRERIIQNVRAISRQTVNPTNQRQVPEELLNAAIAAVRPFLQNTSVFSQADLNQLSVAYNELMRRKGEIRGVDEDMADAIMSLPQLLNGRRLSKLDMSELETLNDIIGNLRAIITEQNKIKVAKQEAKKDEASALFKENMRAKGDAKRTAMWETLRKLILKETTPVYFADDVGGILGQMIRDVIGGESEWAFIRQEAKEQEKTLFDKYHVNDWINDEEHLKFTTQQGHAIEMDRNLALALYATWKRETTNKTQDAQHLRVGGFTYQRDARYKDIDTIRPHILSKSDMTQIMNWLGKEQMEFADQMVEYLSTTLADKGNKVSMSMYGYKKFKEGYYFPYSTEKDYLTGSLTEVGERTKKPSNAGFTKATLKNAATPLEVGGFLETWAKHVNEMAKFVAFSESMDSIDRMMNDRISAEVKIDPETGEYKVIPGESNWAEMRRALGEESVHYLKTFAGDVSGGVRPDNRTPTDAALSLFKKGSVAANLSVAVQQPTAITRAAMMMNPKYLLKVNPGKISQYIKEMYKHSGVALIKDMGRFDTGTGKGDVDWLLDVRDEKNKLKKTLAWIDDKSGILAEKADEITWGALWGAVRNEIKATRADLKADTAEFFDAVTERFEDVVRHTQVYDSVMSKSEIMRSKNAYDKMVTSFKAEPTLTLNMVGAALKNARQPGGKARAGRALGVFVLSALVNALAKSLVTATRRKDDEGRTVGEKYLAEVTENFTGDISLFGIGNMIPWVGEAMSVFAGYTVKRNDMEVIQLINDAFKTIQNDNKTGWEKLRAAAEAASYATGIPLKNVLRDVMGIADTLFLGGSASEITSPGALKYSVLDSLDFGPFDVWSPERKAYYERMTEALIQNDQARYQELRAYMENTNGVSGKMVDSGIKALLEDWVKAGRIDADMAKSILETYLGKDQKAAFQAVEEWTQEAAHADDAEYSYSQYGEVLELAKSGQSAETAIRKLISNGYAEENVRNAIKSGIKEWYMAGEITRAQAETKLKTYAKETDADSLYWLLDEWEYTKRTAGQPNAAKYTKYLSFFQAVETGSGLKAEIQRMTGHGVKEETLASQITSQYKKQYIELYQTNKTAAANLKARLLTAYEALGYDREKKNRDIDKWLDQ